MNVAPHNVLEILDAADSMQVIDMKNYALNLIVEHFPQVQLEIVYLLIFFLFDYGIIYCIIFDERNYIM